MKQIFILIFFIIFKSGFSQEIFLPINSPERHSLENIQLTEIGQFGLWRKARPAVPGHFHTGIDIKRPSENYQNEPVFSIADGIVISKRDDGPFAQLIVEHHAIDRTFWTVYEHIAGIYVSVGDVVNSTVPIARFMNRDELNQYGWQFDHFHFEVLKVRPTALNFDPNKPERCFNSYSLVCFTTDDLNKYFHNPIEFFSYEWR